MFKKEVDVDIVAANYNNGKYLHQFINSIIDSTVWPQQLIIVDDASTDNSIDIINSYSEHKLNIKLVALSKNVGFANALNEGIKHVTATNILRIDPDDIMCADRLKKQFEFISNNTSVDVVGCDVTYFAEDEHIITGHSDFPSEHEEIVKCYEEGNHGMCHGATLFSTKCLIKESYIQKNVPAEEYDIFSRLIKQNYIFANIQEPLTLVRIHTSSVSNNMPYSTVAKTFKLRESLWNKKSSKFYVFKEYIARNAYRKYISTQSYSRYFSLLIAASMKPSSALKRLFGNAK